MSTIDFSTDSPPFANDTPLHMAPLSDYRVLAIYGADAPTFLQGQFTQDVAAATEQTAQLSAYCTAKGRMLASFIFWQSGTPAPDGTKAFHVLVRSDIAEPFAKRLRMFVLRAKVTIEDTGMTPTAYWAGEKTDLAASKLGTPTPWQVVATGSAVQIGLPASTGIQRGLLIGDEDIDAAAAQPGQPEEWAVLDILAGIPWVESANQEMFIPQDVNLDAIGAVSFTKGCYPGQEVVARSHYRGKLKRRMLNGFCDVAGETSPAAGTDITDTTNTREPSGQVVNAARLADRQFLLFEVRLEAAERNQLVLGDENGTPITLLPMPYLLDKPALA